MLYYLYDKKTRAVHKTTSSTKYSAWFKSCDRVIACDRVGDCTVSTVCLGIDYGTPLDSGLPLIFETMIFRDTAPYVDEYCDRYSTIEEAEAGHAEALKVAESMMKNPLKKFFSFLKS